MSLTSEFPFSNHVLTLIKSGLKQQQRELACAIDKTQEEIRTLADFGPGDVVDECLGNSAKEAVFTTYTRNRTQLRKIEVALHRISTGDFGVCAVCGGEIGLKRLQAVPWANNCVECQEQSERNRGQIGWKT